MPVVKILSPKSSPGSVALAKIGSDVSPVLGVHSNLFWVIWRTVQTDDCYIADWRGSDPPCPNTMATPPIIASRENVAYAAREADHCQSRSATAQ